MELAGGLMPACDSGDFPFQTCETKSEVQAETVRVTEDQQPAGTGPAANDRQQERRGNDAFAC